MPHGSWNSSNIELDGKLLDYGSQSTQPGHGMTRGYPRWSNKKGLSLSDSLLALVTAVATGGDEAWRKRAPSRAQLERTFALRKSKTVLHELVVLTGLSDFLPRRRTKAYWDLAFATHALAFIPTEIVDICHRAPRWTGVYDVGRILFCMACLRRRGPAISLDHPALAPLAKAYLALRRELEERMRAAIGQKGLDELIVRLAAIRNDDRPALRQTTLRAAWERRVRAYAGSGDAPQLAACVDEDIESGRRFFSTKRSGEVLLREWIDRRAGGRSWARYHYRYATGYELELKTHWEAGEHRFFSRVAATVIPECSIRTIDRNGIGRTLRHRTRTRAGGSRLRIALAPNVQRVSITLLGGGADDLTLELLPPLYLRGVDRIERDRKMKQRVLPRGGA